MMSGVFKSICFEQDGHIHFLQKKEVLTLLLLNDEQRMCINCVQFKKIL